MTAVALSLQEETLPDRRLHPEEKDLPRPPEHRSIFLGDNLDVMRRWPDACIDLVYADPPFCTGRDFGAFDDRWHGVLPDDAPGIARLAAETHGQAMAAYLAWLYPRLLEIRRLLKPTGSLYLHCDPTAGAYLKVLLDGVMGRKAFRNQIVWRRNDGRPKGSKHAPVKFGRDTDFLLFYTRGNSWAFNCDLDDVKDYPHTESDGRRYRLVNGLFLSNSMSRRMPNGFYEYNGVSPPGGRAWAFVRESLEDLDRNGEILWRDGKSPLRKKYQANAVGKPRSNLWDDIKNTGNGENLGYPTQKPVALLERIVRASSNEGDIVLDPFCGSGTTLVAAQSLGRRFVGIDQNPQAAALARGRITTSRRRDPGDNSAAGLPRRGTPLGRRDTTG